MKWLISKISVAFLLIVSISCSINSSKSDKNKCLPDISELISSSDMSHDSVIEYLTKKRNFILVQSEVIHNQRITILNLNESGCQTIFRKNEWQDQHNIFHTVHYDIKPSTSPGALQNEILRSGFVLKEHVKDEMKEYWLYFQGNNYSISIYQFKSNDLPLSIELHKY